MFCINSIRTFNSLSRAKLTLTSNKLQAALEAYAASVKDRGGTQFDPLYPVMVTILDKAKVTLSG